MPPLARRPETSAGVRGGGDPPGQRPGGQPFGPRNPRGAQKKARGYARGGVAKLPVPLWSCFRREPEDAVCGRNSGLTDGRPAALDWKVKLITSLVQHLTGKA